VVLAGSCECTEYAVGDSRQGVVLQLGGLGEGLTVRHCKETILLRNITQGDEIKENETGAACSTHGRDEK